MAGVDKRAILVFLSCCRAGYRERQCLERVAELA